VNVEHGAQSKNQKKKKSAMKDQHRAEICPLVLKMARTKAELKALKDQVCDLAVLGYSTKQIATDLGLSDRHIRRYLEASRVARAKEQFGKTDEIIGELIESQEKRLRYLFGIIREGTKNEKMKAIALLQQEDQMKAKRHQLAGNLPSEAPTVAIQNTNVVEGATTIADAIRAKFPELIERFKHNKTSRVVDQKELVIEKPKVEPWQTEEPQSSNIQRYSFNLNNNKIRIWFKSSPNNYYEYVCTNDIFMALQGAMSKGSYISQVFKGAKFEKKEDQ